MTMILFINTVSAMGNNPSTCDNRYAARVISFKIDNKSRTIDIPSNNSQTNLEAVVGKGYTVALTLHTANLSSLGNTREGSVWYHTTGYGFSLGTCIKGAHPNSDITITLHNVFMSQATGGMRQQVEFGSGYQPGQFVKYIVHWHSSNYIVSAN